MRRKKQNKFEDSFWSYELPLFFPGLLIILPVISFLWDERLELGQSYLVARKCRPVWDGVIAEVVSYRYGRRLLAVRRRKCAWLGTAFSSVRDKQDRIFRFQAVQGLSIKKCTRRAQSRAVSSSSVKELQERKGFRVSKALKRKSALELGGQGQGQWGKELMRNFIRKQHSSEDQRLLGTKYNALKHAGLKKNGNIMKNHKPFFF